MVVPKGNPDELRKQARYLQSIACFVKDAAKHDELPTTPLAEIIARNLLRSVWESSLALPALRFGDQR
jgi:hypothetical protein